MRKGITPIIAIIVLLLITVALAGTAYIYISNYMASLTEKSIEVTDRFCLGNDRALLRVANYGTSDVPTSEVEILDPETGNDVSTTGEWRFGVNNTLTDIIRPDETVKWLSSPSACANGCTYRVIGAGGRAQTISVC
jgi:flagellin-like protein